MNEELYAPLPSARAYLDRLGISGGVDVSPEGLSALVRAHQTSVPFENYRICEEKLPVELGVKALFEKIVVRRRGGYCFELNGLFYSLLLTLGFEAYPLLCRIARPGLAHPAPLHRVNVAVLGGKRYLLDTGLGGAMPAGAMPFDDGVPVTMHGLTFRLDRIDGCQWLLMRQGGDEQWLPSLLLLDHPSDSVDFLAPNFFCSTSPDSSFVNNRMARICTDDGVKDITGGVFNQRTAGGTVSRGIASRADEFALLREQFGIIL